jgi:hypothetical protein
MNQLSIVTFVLSFSLIRTSLHTTAMKHTRSLLSAEMQDGAKPRHGCME